MHKIKIAVLILFAAFLALFILQNRASVKTVVLFTSFDLPLVLLLVLSLLAGFVLCLVCAVPAKVRPPLKVTDPGPEV